MTAVGHEAVIEYRKFFVAKLTFIRTEFDQVCPI